MAVRHYGAMASSWYNEIMASRKMTFTVPEELARQFVRRVPARDRSRYLADALAAKLAERDHRLIRACEIANQDADIRILERQLDALPDLGVEGWDEATGPEPPAR
jgi:hypothetical protein